MNLAVDGDYSKVSDEEEEDIEESLEEAERRKLRFEREKFLRERDTAKVSSFES